jgi:hypothetical protein
MFLCCYTSPLCIIIFLSCYVVLCQSHVYSISHPGILVGRTWKGYRPSVREEFLCSVGNAGGDRGSWWRTWEAAFGFATHRSKVLPSMLVSVIAFTLCSNSIAFTEYTKISQRLKNMNLFFLPHAIYPVASLRFNLGIPILVRKNRWLAGPMRLSTVPPANKDTSKTWIIK